MWSAPRAASALYRSSIDCNIVDNTLLHKYTIFQTHTYISGEQYNVYDTIAGMLA